MTRTRHVSRALLILGAVAGGGVLLGQWMNENLSAWEVVIVAIAGIVVIELGSLLVSRWR